MVLHGRSAIITGANQGLGEAIATAFIQAGADVLLVARGVERLQQVETNLQPVLEKTQKLIIHPADVSQPEDCAAIVRRAQRELPNLAALVNNAGVYGPIGPVEENDWDAWVNAIQINLFGTVLMCRAVLPYMRKVGYGKIINLSGGGATAPLPRFSSYAASKAAVVRFTETLSQEARETGIDVNSFAPGALNTRLLDRVLQEGPKQVGEEFYNRSLKQRESGGASLENAASLAVFLASAASDGITGRLFSAVWDDWKRVSERRQQLESSDIFTLRRIVPEDRGEKWSA